MAKRGFLFNSVPAPKLKRSAFNLSHEHKTTCGLGTLVPIECIECVPGDTFKITPSMLARMQATISPIMQRIDASVHWFKVPYRLIWEDFEDFITGGKDGTSAPMPPFVQLASIYHDLHPGSLGNYLGLPMPYKLTSSGSWEFVERPSASYLSTEVSTLPFRAYQRIYNDWWRDQNLSDEIEIPMTSGEESLEDALNLIELRRRCWSKDYFTSALIDPQRGQQVNIGLSGNAPVTVDTFQASGSIGDYDSYMYAETQGSDKFFHDSLAHTLTLKGQADLSEASSLTITALRTAFKLQQFLERNNIAGSRYIEQILAHYGVKSSDSRLQRSEYLGSGRIPVIISEVETNADGSGDYDYNVGDLAGKSKAVGGLGTISTFCEEHCFIIGLVSFMPKASYSQGLPRMFSRFDKFDYFWPEFQSIGEQEVKNKELYCSPTEEDNEQTFGYQSRYSEYKYLPDRVSGDFSTSLSYWHMGRLFNQRPALNESFVECVPSDRCFAVSDQYSENSRVVVDVWLDIKAVRPMSIYSTPKIC